MSAELGKEMIVERLRSALGAAVREAREDPEFLGKIAGTICTEFKLDTMTTMLIVTKLKQVIKKKDSPNAPG